MNTVIKDFPDEKWRGFKAKAAKSGITVQEALVQAIDKWVNEK